MISHADGKKPRFQFLNGAIKIKHFIKPAQFIASLQFLNGAIKITRNQFIDWFFPKFQFLNGAIKICSAEVQH